MSKTDKIDSEFRRENKQQKLIIDELVKYVDDLTRSNNSLTRTINSLTRTINSLTRSNDKLKHKLSYYDIHIRHHLASPCKWKRTRNREKIESNRGGVFGHDGIPEILSLFN